MVVDGRGEEEESNDILLYGLKWRVPGIIYQLSRVWCYGLMEYQDEFEMAASDRKITLITIKWLQGAKRVYDLGISDQPYNITNEFDCKDIDYKGVWNEKSYEAS